MVDFHSHILPAVDDGSQSVEESQKLLGMLASQGVTRVVATPHFYPNRQSVEEFIENRRQAFEKLTPTPVGPEIFLGAEIKFYSGISKLEQLKSLCIQNTKLLLIEMPFCRWAESDVNEVISLSCMGYTVILAHVERYLSLQRLEIIEALLANGILFQVNASYFKGFTTKGKAMKMLKNNMIHLIGSDCHDIASRPPQMDAAIKIITAKLGEAFLNSFKNYSRMLLCENDKK